jgi:hypothetical protein
MSQTGDTLMVRQALRVGELAMPIMALCERVAAGFNANAATLMVVDKEATLNHGDQNEK